MNPNPLDNGELYDSIVLAGVKSPGKVTLSGHDRVTKWDVKEGNGQTGATTTLKSRPPVEFTASFYLLRDLSQGIDDIGDWPAFDALIHSTVAGKKPKALDVYHPDLAANGIKSVVEATVSGIVHDGKGGMTVAVKFQVYAPPKPKGGSPSGSSTKKPAANDPNAAAEAELARLTKQYQDTPFG